MHRGRREFCRFVYNRLCRYTHKLEEKKNIEMRCPPPPPPMSKIQLTRYPIHYLS